MPQYNFQHICHFESIEQTQPLSRDHIAFRLYKCFDCNKTIIMEIDKDNIDIDDSGTKDMLRGILCNESKKLLEMTKMPFDEDQYIKFSPENLPFKGFL